MSQVRHAFTIWELLVVIIVVLLLMALLLPAVHTGHSQGRRDVCINNQRQIALALYQYEQAFGQYPGYAIPQATIDAPQGDISSRPVSWAFAIMSRLERADIADNYGAAAPAGNKEGPFTRPDFRVKVLTCPSDPSTTEDPSSAQLSYVVNTGLKDPEPESSMPAGVPRDWPENGIFHFGYPYTGKNDFDVPVRNTGDPPNAEQITTVSGKFISDHDGLTTTLMLSENVDAGLWTDALEHQLGFYWQATLDGNPPAQGNVAPDDWLELPLLRINEQTLSTPGELTPREQRRYGRPSSFHPGGVHASYADAHTSFLNNDIDYRVFCQLMTPDGANSGAAGTRGMRNGRRILFRDQPGDRAKFATQKVDEDSL